MDILPLAVKEKTPGFLRNRSIYSTAKTGPISDQLVKEVFEQTKIVLGDSTPPTTQLTRMLTSRPLPEKYADLRIKLSKNDPIPSASQQSIIDESKSQIRSAIKKIGAWFNYNQQ